jgi:ribose transport system ATP-binding protein
MFDRWSSEGHGLPLGMADPLLQVQDVSKSFGGAKALSSVQFELLPDEIHAIVGENGAGKSTLIKILMGVYPRDSGTIKIGGQEVDIRSPHRARALGLAAVYQDIMLARHLSVGENFFMGNLPQKGGFVNWGLVFGKANQFLSELGVHVNSREIVSHLTIARQQLVAIAKVVWQGAKLIIFDEPTALLTTPETEMLFQIIRRLKRDGKSVIYISHRMEEIFGICDRVTVLKDGKYVGTRETAETTRDQLISMMVGRELTHAFPAREYHRGSEQILEVRNLNSGKRFRDINFTLHRREIFGIYGLVGAGRTELIRAIFGASRYDAGEILLKGKRIKPSNPKKMIRRGFGLICEDRKHQSLAMPLDVKTNLNLVTSKQTSKLGIIQNRAETQITDTYIRTLSIRTSSPYQRVRNLSGGNQQKVVIGKWLSVQPDILFFDEPTSGVDVGARVEIYQLMQKLIDDGKAMIVISSYLPEVMALSDRIMVMHEGKSMGIVEAGEADEETLLRMASGLARSTNSAST